MSYLYAAKGEVACGVYYDWTACHSLPNDYSGNRHLEEAV